jgi:hypothetical protein
MPDARFNINRWSESFMKKLLVPLLFSAPLLCASHAAFSQATVTPEYDLGYHIFWNYDVPLTLNYSTLDAPPSAPRNLVVKVLGDIEARINGLDIPGLSLRIGNTELAVNCDIRRPSEVTICWENRQGETSNFQTYNRTDDVNFWQEANIIMGKNTEWDEPMLYQWLSHHVMHIIGFSHPEGSGTSVLNGAADFTQMDIDALRHRYRANHCALTYTSEGRIPLPFVKYQGGAFTASLQNDGAGFSIVPGSLGRYGSQSYNIPPPDAATSLRVPLPVPATPCPALEIDGNNELHVPEIWVNGSLFEGTLVYTNGRFALKSAGPK